MSLLLVIPIIFVSLGVVVFLIIPSSYAQIDASNANHIVIKKNLLYNCLAYRDERSYPGIIDLTTFREDAVQRCLDLSGDSYGVVLDLKYDNKNSEIFVNKQMTDRIVFCSSRGSFQCSSEDVYIIVYENNQLRAGLLNIKIIGFKK
ncbi:hypothetical protein HY500_00715 [Candidatus Woesearchaeota archaeon]|nr:hypothetical protein [Candidatus Woesearchaeota archaeon]